MAKKKKQQSEARRLWERYLWRAKTFVEAKKAAKVAAKKMNKAFNAYWDESEEESER